MPFAKQALSQPRPASIRRNVDLPRRQQRHAGFGPFGSASPGEIIAYVEIRDLPPSEVLVLANRAKADGGAVLL